MADDFWMPKPSPLSHAEREDVAHRARRRAAILRPKAVVEVAFETVKPSSAAEIFCRIVGDATPPLPGFRRLATYPLQTREPLHVLLGRWHPSLGKAFAPTGPFHHVGSRPSARRVAGWREEYWVPDGDRGPEVDSHRDALAIACVTVGGIGYAPAVGATAASALGCLVAALLGIWLPWSVGVVPVMAGFALIASAVGVACERSAERHFLDDDAREFVIDELAGVSVAILFVPASNWWWGLVVAFVAFRFFDVLKPGIRWVEARHWRGAVVWDDLLAGLYAGLATGGIIATANAVAG